LSVAERAIHAGEATGDAAMTARLDSTGHLQLIEAERPPT